MRITLVTILGLSLAVATQAAPVGDDVLNPVSVRMADAGRAALARGDASAAIDSFEAALASDPKNVGAFTGIAQSYEKLGLPGKAVKYYREALALNPSDLVALEGQGKAYVSRGATARAQVNLARIKALCKTDCSAATRLEAALNAPVVATAAPAKVATTTN
jgi:Tfp pilus assembly protein PilF